MSLKKATCRIERKWEALHRTTAAKRGFKDVKPVTDNCFFVLPPSNAWLEVPLDETWMTAYRIAMQNGSPVVAEVRIFPSEPGKRRAPGEWRGSWKGMNADVTGRGVTCQALPIRSGLGKCPHSCKKFTARCAGSIVGTLIRFCLASQPLPRSRNIPLGESPGPIQNMQHSRLPTSRLYSDTITLLSGLPR